MEVELARGLAPNRLAYLTFTKDARKVALRRACEAFNKAEEDFPFFKTLHSICYHELNMSIGGMVNQKYLQEFGKLLGIKFSYRMRHMADDMLDFPQGSELGDRLLQFDHVRRHSLQTYDEAWRGVFDDDVTPHRARHFVRTYQEWKRAEGLRDFTDLLEQASIPLAVDVVIVDEAQDLSRLQWATLHRLCRFASRMYIAGDDDQAIYTWAGASPDAFIEHPGEVRVLGKSHRLPERVYALADRIVRRIRVRQPKEWRPRDFDGSVSYRGDSSGLPFDREGRWLVLYRHHYLVEELEQEVRLRGLTYSRNDKPAPGAEWGKAIIFWERLRRGRELSWAETNFVLDGIAVDQGITKQALSSFRKSPRDAVFSSSTLSTTFGLQNIERPWFEALTKIRPTDVSYLRAIIRSSGADALVGQPRVHLSTIHAAKGSEAENVVLMTETSRRVREDIDLKPDDERRVFYVGVTRAKETLTVVGVDNPLFR